MNYCECHLTIRSSSRELIDTICSIVQPPPKLGFVRRFYEQIFPKHRSEVAPSLLEFLCPVPREFKIAKTDDKVRINKIKDELRAWREQHWGCPFEEEISGFDRLDELTICIRLNTPYSPPLRALMTAAKISKLSFKIDYFDYQWLLGTATENDKREFRYEDDVEPEKLDIPNELIKLFDLKQRYHDIKNGLI